MSEDKDTIKYGLNIQVRDFTSQSKGDKFEFVQFNCRQLDIEGYLFSVKVFPSGRCNENKGYLSVMFVSTERLGLLINDFDFFEFVCTASVVDANGDERFRQSFVYSHEPQLYVELENFTFGFEKYLKTETLLSDSFELLPCDCLTMYMEITIRHGNLIVDPIVCSPNSEESYSEDGDKFYLNLDSIAGNLLCKYSNVFRRLSEIPMIEKEARQVYIVPEEYSTIGYIIGFISGIAVTIPVNEYIPVMLEIYVVAEKYDIELVFEDCRLRLESFLNSISDWKCLEHGTENIPSILELAETYRDKRLREGAENFLKNREETEARLKDEMEMEPNIIERKSSVCCYGRKVSSAVLLEDVASGYEVNPHLDVYT